MSESSGSAGSTKEQRTLEGGATGNARPLLRAENLAIAFAGHEAVRGISFEIAPGGALGLVGESGSGKSVTSLALLRLLPPDARVSGRILFTRNAAGLDGPEALDLLALKESEMRARRGREIAMIFQEPMTALNPVMRVGQQIAEAVRSHHSELSRAAVRDRVLDAMREVALPDPERRLKDYPHQFSGGQRQRIMIAMALVNRPRLLIADEPTTALDVTVQAQVLELLRRLRTTHGLSMLFISHDLAVVAQACDRPGDRIAVMRHGEIVEYAPARQLFASPQHEYTRKLLASAPTMQTDRSRPLAALA
ncbi:MAG TPA: ABC transporter ATP-binding protein [Acidobacteriaceae bacterium]|nr:ABC transporter ATP-binding protein [Acidobacteriaceae bacterium]